MSEENYKNQTWLLNELQTKSRREIAKEQEVTHSAIRYWAKRLGIVYKVENGKGINYITADYKVPKLIEDMTIIPFKLSFDLKERFQMYAHKQDKTMSGIMRDYINELLKNNKEIDRNG